MQEREKEPTPTAISLQNAHSAEGHTTSRSQMVGPGFSSRKLRNLAAPLPKVRHLLSLTGSPLCCLPGLSEKLMPGLIRGDTTHRFCSGLGDRSLGYTLISIIFSRSTHHSLSALTEQ